MEFWGAAPTVAHVNLVEPAMQSKHKTLLWTKREKHEFDRNKWALLRSFLNLQVQREEGLMIHRIYICI
jgi:hypothetical protein